MNGKRAKMLRSLAGQYATIGMTTYEEGYRPPTVLNGVLFDSGTTLRTVPECWRSQYQKLKRGLVR